MALGRYVLTATVTVPAGTPATVTAGEPGTGGAAGHGNASISAGAALWPTTFIAGTPIVLDPTGALYTAIGAGNLRAYVQGSDDVGHAALSNLSVVLNGAAWSSRQGCLSVVLGRVSVVSTGTPPGDLSVVLSVVLHYA
jgi:hypothetical protein